MDLVIRGELGVLEALNQMFALMKQYLAQGFAIRRLTKDAEQVARALEVTHDARGLAMNALARRLLPVASRAYRAENH